MVPTKAEYEAAVAAQVAQGLTELAARAAVARLYPGLFGCFVGGVAPDFWACHG